MKKKLNNLNILLISIHGLIRGENLELGRDADTGGQTKYVVELAKALAERKEIAKVYLLTRLIDDVAVSKDYSQKTEKIADNAFIIRIPCGGPDYLAKEQLWDSLDNFVDNTRDWLAQQERLPDVIHSHYADAGLVGARLAHHFGIPLIHTGHSLGRSKRKRLLACGSKGGDIERKYLISRRINAEEETLGAADLVITSTKQEIEEQYEVYDFYQPEAMRVVPPGTDLKLFTPPQGNEKTQPIYKELCRFFSDPDKPIILAISRPDPRKNIITMLEAYGESEELQNKANLVIVAGNRDDINELDSDARAVLQEILLTIDRLDLYGKVAYPKHHKSGEVPTLYRLATVSKGVFINPALVEPFGLTIIEAAASGLPVVVTEDGGPQDIIGNCQNGYLIDPLDKDDITEKLIKILSDTQKWQSLAENGLKGVRKNYSWQAHAKCYVELIIPLVARNQPVTRMRLSRRPRLYHDRAIVTDIDQNLLGDPESLTRLIEIIQVNRKCTMFAVATGRRLDGALKILKKHNIPFPDILITSLGTEIHYAPNLQVDKAWANHIDHLWNPKRIHRLVRTLPGLKVQSKKEQNIFKISYFIDPEKAPDLKEINRFLLRHDQSVNVIQSFGQFLDITPMRASKGMALRWVNEQWGIPLENTLTAGGSGADEDLMRGNTMAVVVANRHKEELSDLSTIEHIYFAKKPYAAGIIEALDYYDFFQTCGVTQNGK
jgi:sucrose-phosphate synthase